MIARFVLIILAVAAGIALIIYAVNKAFDENAEAEKRLNESKEKILEKTNRIKEYEKHNSHIYANYDVVIPGSATKVHNIQEFSTFLDKAKVQYKQDFVYEEYFNEKYEKQECLLLPKGTYEVLYTAFDKYQKAIFDKNKKEVEDKANEILKKVGIENV